MRAYQAIALSLSLLPTTACINLDLANGEQNIVEAQVDISGAGFLLFKNKNIKFEQVVTVDPFVDEQRVGALAIDTINFNEPLQIEISYVVEDMIRLEGFLKAGNPDPRGLVEGDDPTLFQTSDGRTNYPYTVTFMVTFPRKEQILNDNGRRRRIRTVETRAAYCNFIDPIDANAKGCVKFQPNDDPNVQNIIGSVAGVGGEDTIVAEFKDLIVIDEELYDDIFEAALIAGDAPNAEDLAESILVRVARDEPGKMFVFNANLDEDLE
jgi:hypothetical protein